MKNNSKSWDFDTLKVELIEALNRFSSHQREALLAARDSGEALIKLKYLVKKKLGHGHWCKWVNEHLPISHSTATDYMRIANNWNEKIQVNLNDDAPLSIKVALGMLKGEDSKNGLGSQAPETLTEQSKQRLMREMEIHLLEKEFIQMCKKAASRWSLPVLRNLIESNYLVVFEKIEELELLCPCEVVEQRPIIRRRRSIRDKLKEVTRHERFSDTIN
ncbi:DUF3102 domain-containing protein [Coraliomargarita sp. W4R72]